MNGVVNQDFCCPHCQALTPVELETPLYLTCSHCELLMLVNHALPPNVIPQAKRKWKPSPIITFSSTGSIDNQPFKVIGMIRRIYNNTLNIEWLLKCTNGTLKWLITSGASYFTVDTQLLDMNYDLIRNVKVGQEFEWRNSTFQLVDIAKQNQVYVEGQVPEDALFSKGLVKLEIVDITSYASFTVLVNHTKEVEVYRVNKVALQDLKLSSLTAFSTWV